MRNVLYSTILVAGATVLGSSVASAAPAIGGNPAIDTSAVHKVQGFGIYIGPGYGYYDPYWSYGYYPGYYGYGYRRYYRPYYGYYGYRGGHHRYYRHLHRHRP